MRKIWGKSREKRRAAWKEIVSGSSEREREKRESAEEMEEIWGRYGGDMEEERRRSGRGGSLSKQASRIEGKSRCWGFLNEDVCPLATTTNGHTGLPFSLWQVWQVLFLALLIPKY
jgi:hypothetical protein